MAPKDLVSNRLPWPRTPATRNHLPSIVVGRDNHTFQGRPTAAKWSTPSYLCSDRSTNCVSLDYRSITYRPEAFTEAPREVVLMKAAIIHRTGPASELQVTDIPMPEVGPGEIRVKVAAAAVKAGTWPAQ